MSHPKIEKELVETDAHTYARTLINFPHLDGKSKNTKSGKKIKIMSLLSLFLHSILLYTRTKATKTKTLKQKLHRFSVILNSGIIHTHPFIHIDMYMYIHIYMRLYVCF